MMLSLFINIAIAIASSLFLFYTKDCINLYPFIIASVALEFVKLSILRRGKVPDPCFSILLWTIFTIIICSVLSAMNENSWVMHVI